MDILTHVVVGVAIGSTLVICSKNSNPFKKISIVGAGALGGALPDVDAISLWSGFDASFGKLFGLQHSGKQIYFGKYWYSHHGFMHSLLASIIMGLLFLFLSYCVKQHFRNLSLKSFGLFVKNNSILYISFLLGYIAHLFCDMLTPASTWGGVNLLYPLKTYVGGWGAIWWWNNYDIFLIVITLITINVFLLMLGKWIKAKTKIAVVSLFLAVLLIAVQVKTRRFDFNYTGYSAKTYQINEAKSKEIQKKLLGKKLYTQMEKFDNKIPLNF